MRVLVAGGTGYLGRHVGEELRRRGHWVRALVRRSEQRDLVLPFADEIVIGEVTKPDSLRGVAADTNVVFSSVGITRQREGLTYEDVDYRGNLNLLAEATRARSERFVYVSIFRGRELRQVDLIDAKERFVEELRGSPISSTVIRPTGFFSDMADILRMAQRGIVVLLGDGAARINPVSGRDVAVACSEAMTTGVDGVDVGGPETFTYDEIAQLTFRSLGKHARIWHVPSGAMRALLRLMRPITPVGLYGPLQFICTTNSTDLVAPARGSDRLETFFQSMVRDAGTRIPNLRPTRKSRA